MKIDIASLIIAAVALAFFFVPIAWYQISQKLKTKKIANDLFQFAKEQNAELTEHEVWDNRYAIGLDQKTKKLLYLKNDQDKEARVFVDLSVIDNCKVVNGTKNIRGAKGNMSITNNIRLQLHYRKPGKAPDMLEIFNGENGKTLTSEISIANKWSKSITSLLHKHSESKSRLPVL